MFWDFYKSKKKTFINNLHLKSFDTSGSDNKICLNIIPN